MQRSPRLRVIFALSSCLAICCLPDARGEQTYKQSTIGAQLTAEEYRNYQLYHVLPPRFQYSAKHGAYIETEAGAGAGRGTAANNGGNREGQVLMPRWQAMLRGFMPGGAGPLPSMESLAQMASLPSQGSSAPSEGSAPDAESAPAQGSGMLGSLSDNWKNVQDAVTGGSGAGDPAGKGDGDAAEEAAPGLMKSTYNVAKDVATSELGQEAIKFALGFMPGGGSAVKAFDIGNKLYSMSSKTDDVADKIPGVP